MSMTINAAAIIRRLIVQAIDTPLHNARFVEMKSPLRVINSMYAGTLTLEAETVTVRYKDDQHTADLIVAAITNNPEFRKAFAAKKRDLDVVVGLTREMVLDGGFVKLGIAYALDVAPALETV